MPRKRKATHKGSKTEAVVEFILSHKGREVDASTVADSLGLDRKVVATLLSRLASEGKVTKLGRGRYSASGRVRTQRPSTARRLSAKADEGWKRAYDDISKEIAQALGPASDRIRRDGSRRRSATYRAMTEELVKELRGGMGGRMALDMVQPILETIFGENGKETAMRMCFPAGGGA